MNKLSAIVTTGKYSKQYQAKNILLAEEVAGTLNIPYVPKDKYSLAAIREKYQVPYIMVARQGLLELETPNEKLFFHAGLAHLRIKNLRLGKSDHLVTAMNIIEGMKVLDCTLGMGADAIVMSYAVGDTGEVTALEASPLIERVIGHGLANAIGDNYDIHSAMRRIKTHAVDALHFLQASESNSYDAIYFDPMFRHPFYESNSLNALRELADDRALTAELIAEACRVAKNRVVMKESSLSTEFMRLGFEQIVGGKYSKIHYGIIEV